MAVAILSRERLRTLREFAMTQVTIADACARRAQSREPSESVVRKVAPLPVVERRPMRAGVCHMNPTDQPGLPQTGAADRNSVLRMVSPRQDGRGYYVSFAPIAKTTIPKPTITAPRVVAVINDMAKNSPANLTRWHPVRVGRGRNLSKRNSG